MNPTNPYAPPKSQLIERVVVDTALVRADRGQRLAAALVDGALVMAVLGVMLWLEYKFLAGGRDWPPKGSELLLVQVANSMIAFASYILMNGVLLQRYGQTIGKRLLDIRIVRVDGSQATLIDLLLRRYLLLLLIKFIPYVGIAVATIDPLLIFGSERRCLHDYLAGTIVVRAES